MNEQLPTRGAVFWPVGSGDSTTLVIDEETVIQVDLRDMAKADADDTPEVPVVDVLVDCLPHRDGKPYLAVFALTHADKDHCSGFADLLEKVTIGELWATPRLWREYLDGGESDLCADARAFQEEAERRIEEVRAAVARGEEPASGDRLIVIGYDTDHDKHAYDDLPARFKGWPGQAITVVDGVDRSDRFEAFIHAPFKADAAEARNETSLAMQITLRDESGVDGCLLLLGDLAHDTIMKIFSYSEANGRPERLAWDLLLAPHHSSKRVMYLRSSTGDELLQEDVLDAFEKHRREGAVIVASSARIPDQDTDGANPPHKMAADRYSEIADQFINTMSWLDVNEPSPVVFGVDATGVGIVEDTIVELAAESVLASAGGTRSRLAVVAAGATRIAKAVHGGAPGGAMPTGPEQVRQAIATDRGGDKAPQNAIGFGR